jgi:hypothetical protein
MKLLGYLLSPPSSKEGARFRALRAIIFELAFVHDLSDARRLPGSPRSQPMTTEVNFGRSQFESLTWPRSLKNQNE